MKPWPTLTNTNPSILASTDASGLSLGFTGDAPREVGGALTLLYQGGEKCSTDPKANASVLITFTCNQQTHTLV